MAKDMCSTIKQYLNVRYLSQLEASSVGPNNKQTSVGVFAVIKMDQARKPGAKQWQVERSGGVKLAF